MTENNITIYYRYIITIDNKYNLLFIKKDKKQRNFSYFLYIFDLDITRIL